MLGTRDYIRLKAGQALYGPADIEYEEVDLEALELHERALQGLSRTKYEEEES